MAQESNELSKSASLPNSRHVPLVVKLKPKGPKKPSSVLRPSDGCVARQEKIAKIIQAIEDGSYYTDSSKVASKLIDHMLKI